MTYILGGPCTDTAYPAGDGGQVYKNGSRVLQADRCESGLVSASIICVTSDVTDVPGSWRT